MALPNLQHPLPHRRDAPLPLERVQHPRVGVVADQPPAGAGPTGPEEAAEAAGVADSTGLAAEEGKEGEGAAEGL